jgi:hypothetical protein
MADRNGIVQRAPLPPLNSPLINEADRARVSVESSATSGRLAALAGIDQNNPRQTLPPPGGLLGLLLRGQHQA